MLCTAGLHELPFSGQGGCDSTVLVNIEILQKAESAVEMTVCAGDTAWVGGKSFVAAGNYSVTIPAVNGCDSTISAKIAQFACNLMRYSSATKTNSFKGQKSHCFASSM